MTPEDLDSLRDYCINSAGTQTIAGWVEESFHLISQKYLGTGKAVLPDIGATGIITRNVLAGLNYRYEDLPKVLNKKGIISWVVKWRLLAGR